MLPNKIIDDYIEKKIAFYKDLKSHHIEDISISDSIIINREFISALESDFTDFIKLREKSNNIPRKENESFKKALIEKFELLKVIKENNEKPSIYWFEIINKSDSQNEKLWKKFRSSKNIGAGWWTKANNDVEFNTNILYLGKVEKNLFGRLLQHLGIAHKKTSSLKLRKWFKDFEDVDLKFRYIQFDQDILPYLEDFENIYWRNFKPLLGQEPNIR